MNERGSDPGSWHCRPVQPPSMAGMEPAADAVIALFGGAFNPPHLGHVLCAVWARVMAGVDAVWVLPTVEHPYAKTLIPFTDRLELCRLAFAGLPWVEVRDDEAGNPGGRTINLVEHLIAAWPGRRWRLLGGSDTHRDLPNWYRASDLCRLVEVIEVPRRGWDDHHPGALPGISSSAVRSRLASGGDASDLVPAAVLARIRERGLYQNPRGASPSR